MIMMEENKCNPITRAIPTCIPQIAIKQGNRVRFIQIKSGYAVSNKQTAIPAAGRRKLQDASVCEDIRS